MVPGAETYGKLGVSAGNYYWKDKVYRSKQGGLRRLSARRVSVGYPAPAVVCW